MQKATVESISKSTIVVSHEAEGEGGNMITTLSGAQVEKISSDLKLGDMVEFTVKPNVIVKKVGKGKTAERRQGSSPAGGIPTARQDW